MAYLHIWGPHRLCGGADGRGSLWKYCDSLITFIKFLWFNIRVKVFTGHSFYIHVVEQNIR